MFKPFKIGDRVRIITYSKKYYKDTLNQTGTITRIKNYFKRYNSAFYNYRGVNLAYGITLDKPMINKHTKSNTWFFTHYELEKLKGGINA